MARPIEFDPHGNVVLKIHPFRALVVLVVIGLAVAAAFAPLDGLTLGQRITLSIFVGAVGFWVTEAIPPFATAILVVVLQVYLLGMPGGPLGAAGGDEPYRLFLNPIASPVIVLFFGGFVMAIAASKHGLDVRMARAFLKPFGDRPAAVLLGIIAITGLFSMFMSNTATTAMMITILAPVFQRLEGRDPFKRALVLAVPFAANIGGMGTIIGTPPNAVAASVIAQMGHPVSFLRWMAFGVPLVAVLLGALWAILLRLYRPSGDSLDVLFPEPTVLTWDLLAVSGTFAVTVLLWMTEPLHAIPTAVVSLLPVVVFATLRIIDADDLARIDWDVLILVAGGLSLGVSMQRSGLSALLVSNLPVEGLPPAAALGLVCAASVLVSNFMSHTSASNILIPIAAALPSLPPAWAAVGVALASSTAMSLPISTPPNAIAFATEAVTTREMAKAGTIVSLVSLAAVPGAILLFDRWAGL